MWNRLYHVVPLVNLVVASTALCFQIRVLYPRHDPPGTQTEFAHKENVLTENNQQIAHPNSEITKETAT